MDSSDFYNAVTHNYVMIASLTLLFYDYFLTFAAEVSRVWPQPISRNTLLFFLNRYIGISGNILASAFFFSGIKWSSESCSNLTYTREALLFVNQIVVAAILATRTSALYNRSRAIVISILGFGILLAAISGWFLVGQHSTLVELPGVPGCHYSLSEHAAVRMAVAWEASALFDAFIFALTLMRTLKMRRSHNLAISLTGKGLVDVIVRDGALFFAVMALANFANIFTFYFSRPFLKGLFSAPANCISSALCSRLVLNLYEVATPDDTNLVSSRNPMTTVVLTMPFEFGTMATDDERSEE